MASKKPAAKKPAAKRAAAKKPAAAKKVAAVAPASAGVIELGPPPLVADQEITITASKLPPGAVARITIIPEGSRSGVREMKADPFGQVQTAIIPVAGPHKVVVEWAGGSAERDFDVAAE